ncbi:CBS domain-containing protein [Desulfotignum phosphitoxidans]|uniref:Glutamate dehydrogenase n=1 Tax=Desulfotignum phosphitoxidans DSM 13687 TaxID=1286635 RepID=S0G2X1_9BACT|nr:CBS domain-containing protein [Desulfotignum phosphitoxidans]EMS81230.1 glutamate dehydrogenase [Desulfotignum phosphitoxidans DSM 13687]
MIPLKMKALLQKVLPDKVWQNRLIKDGPLRFMEFGPLDVDRLQRLGIRVDRLGPRLVVCMWDEDSPLEIGGFLVVDNLAMGQPAMGGTRMLPDITPDIIHNLARGMTLKNAAAALPFGGGKSGIVRPEDLTPADRPAVITGFGRLLKRYRKIYIPGPDVGTNDADMKIFAIENGLNNAVSKPADMGGNRIDELGGAANGVVVAFKTLVKQLPRLKNLPQFRHLTLPSLKDQTILIQGFGAVGAHVARIFHEYDPHTPPVIKGISDAHGFLMNENGLPWQQLFDLWKQFGEVTRRYFHDTILHGTQNTDPRTIYSSCADNLLRESGFCLIPASPVSNYLDVDASSNPSMTVDRMGHWQLIVEGANTYSPDPAKKAARRHMERHVYRDKGVLIAKDFLVNSGGVIYAAHERMIPTPDDLLIPKDILGHSKKIDAWLHKNQEAFAQLAEIRRKAAVEKLETVIRNNMEELIDGLCKDADSLPCDVAETISIRRIASMEKTRTAKDVMEDAPTIGVDRQVADAARLLVKSRVSIVNVVSETGKLIGIVTNWDITRAMASHLPMDAPLTRVMTTDVIATGPDTPILDCVRMLENHEISAMPIVKKDRVAGIVSGDILAKKTLFRLLQTMD